MRRMTMAMGMCAMLAFGQGAFAQQKGLAETMKAMSEPLQSLKKNIDGKNAADAAKDAQKLASLFKASDGTWTKAKFDDASKLSKDAQAAANSIVVAVKANKFPDALTSYGAITKSCSGCHMAHRERLPDGTFKMK